MRRVYNEQSDKEDNMVIQKRFSIGFFIFSILLLATSCATFNHKNPYPDMEIVKYGESQAYVFRNDSSKKILISIEGSGWSSVLGEKGDKRWQYTEQGAQLLQVLGDEYTFLIPEKLNRQPGLEYSGDKEDRANYTAENLINCYVESINGYLAEHSFSSIVLIGTSEGAILLPLVYENMNDKDAVTAMVSFALGGLSLYESYGLLVGSPVTPEGWDVMYRDIIITRFNPENNDPIDSFEEAYWGLTKRWFKSILHIRPFDYYKNINIPILFIHGEKDYNVPVESTRYIQKNLLNKPFEYRYYDWGHNPELYFDNIELRNDIAKWVIKTDRK